jgi:hypothetical protein
MALTAPLAFVTVTRNLIKPRAAPLQTALVAAAAAAAAPELLVLPALQTIRKDFTDGGRELPYSLR